MPTTRLLGLERRGWRRGAPQDGGVQGRFDLPLGELTAVVDVDPGIVVAEPTMLAERVRPHGAGERASATAAARDLTPERLADRPVPGFDPDGRTTPGPVGRSEALRDLEDVVR